MKRVPQTAHEFALSELRREILTGFLGGGQRLRQSDIAKRLGVSTTPVREALRDLATEGLVRFDSRRGAEVTSLNLGDVSDLWELRMVLEPFAMKIAIERLSTKDFQAAELCLERMDKELDSANWLIINREFHEIFQAACHFPALEKTLRQVQDQSSMYLANSVDLSPGRLKQGQREHRAIFSALLLGDEKGAQDASRLHLMGALSRIPGYGEIHPKT